MRKLALGIGCVVLVGCGGYEDLDLPTSEGEKGLWFQTVDLHGKPTPRKLFLQAAAPKRADLAGQKESAALDLERFALHEDEICGGKGCPVATDSPCEVHWFSVWMGSAVPVCACEYREYLFPCR